MVNGIASATPKSRTTRSSRRFVLLLTKGATQGRVEKSPSTMPAGDVYKGRHEGTNSGGKSYLTASRNCKGRKLHVIIPAPT